MTPTGSTPSHLNRPGQTNRPEPLVAFLTTYSRMTVTAEETDAMLRRAYGTDRIPGTESRRRSQMGKDTRTCGMPECTETARSCGWCYQHCNAIHRHGLCELPGCDMPYYGLGLCRPHYARHRRTGEEGADLAAWRTRSAPVQSHGEVRAEMGRALALLTKEVTE
jgi:hypothetical protein